MCQVLYIKYSCYESGALHKVHLLCARSSVSKIIHHPSLSALGQHPGIRQRPKWWQVGRYLWTEEQTEAQRGQASSLSCRTGRNLCLSYHQACLSPLPCCSTPIYKGQCLVNLGSFIVVESQALWWPLWGDLLRSLYHHMDGSYNHIQNAPPSGSTWPFLDPVQNCSEVWSQADRKLEGWDS